MDIKLDIQTGLEKMLVEKLKFDDSITEELKSQLTTYYFSAKESLKRIIYEEIKAVEKDLTRHSIGHIVNVQEKAAMLIGNDGKSRYNGVELYFLALSILFHDVGNIMMSLCVGVGVKVTFVADTINIDKYTVVFVSNGL